MKNVGTILSVKELLKAFGGPAQVARALNLKPSRVTEWQARGTIPAVFHKVLVDLAVTFGIAGVTAEVIDQICSPSLQAAE